MSGAAAPSLLLLSALGLLDVAAGSLDRLRAVQQHAQVRYLLQVTGPLHEAHCS